MLYDSDKAGIDATMRGVDMILSAGMNVNICTFPDGQDPDSYCQERSLNEIESFLNKNSIDFIQFKALSLSKQDIDDPILKAKTINDIVSSISIIPDKIKQELYVKHCSKIMEVSEELLFNSLAQKNKSELSHLSKRRINKVQKTSKNIEVDVLFELEKKIIEILLLYGNQKEKFEEVIIKKDKNGEVLMEPSIVESFVYEKIFLDLQQDEVEFTNESFQILFSKILVELQKNGELVLDIFLNSLDTELSSHVTSILMNEDRYQLHNWLSKDIVVKEKKMVISQLVSETILSLRTYLINEKVKELQEETKNKSKNNDEILEEITDYHKLKSLLSKKLNRVL
jgi:DNA primase